MALFESYERREKKILSVLKEYGIKSIEECKEITDKKGIDVDKIVRGTQPICFENAVWAYTVGGNRYRTSKLLYHGLGRRKQKGWLGSR